MNTPMPMGTNREVSLRVVIYTDVAVVNVPSKGGARSFVTFIYEASRDVSCFCIN